VRVQGGEPVDEPRGDEPRALDAAARPSRTLGPVAFRVLRVALDWVRVLYREWVTGKAWKRLRACAETSGALDLVLPLSGEVLTLKVKRKGDSEIRLDGDGVHLVVRARPEAPRAGLTPADPVVRELQRARLEVKRAAAASQLEAQPYGVEFDVQGRALSASCDGFDVLDDVRTGVEQLLFRHHGATLEGRRAALAPCTYLGRFDLAVDVAVAGLGASTWIEHRLFRGGHLDRARADWSSRARAQDGHRAAGPDDETSLEGDTRLQGTEARGRTIYFGSQPLLARLYVKDKHWGESAGALQATLAELGWNGADRVVRMEFEMHRAWLRDQKFDDVRGHTLTLDELLGTMPLIARRLAVRYRHTEGAAKVPAYRRPTSRYWCAVVDGLEQFAATRPEVARSPFKLLRSVKRGRRIEAAAERGARALVVIEAAGDEHGRELATHEALRVVLDARHDPRLAERFAELRHRVRRELGWLPARRWDDDDEGEPPSDVRAVGT
jgi:hypothetical protein